MAAERKPVDPYSPGSAKMNDLCGNLNISMEHKGGNRGTGKSLFIAIGRVNHDLLPILSDG